MPAPQVDYDALAKQHGATSSAVDYDALATQNGAVGAAPAAPAPPAPSTGQQAMSAAGNAAKGFAQETNPASMLKGLQDLAVGLVHHPIDTVSSVAQAQTVPLGKAIDAFKRGDYVEAARHFAGYAIPLAGPSIDSMGDEAQNGQMAHALGRAAGFGLTAAAGDPVALARKVAAPAAEAASRVAGKVAPRVYQSALKPSFASNSLPEIGDMVKTGLDNQIPVSKAGLNKLQGLMTDLNDKIGAVVNKGQNKGLTIDPNAATQPIDQLRPQLANQANPVADLNTLDRSKAEFLQTQGAKPAVPAGAPQPTGILDARGNPVMSPGTPARPALPAQPIPVAQAQAIKQGTYRQLKDSYGQEKTAQVESEKALARGIKDELNTALPELRSLNEKESQLFGLQPALEAAVNRTANHDIVGVPGAAAAGAAGAHLLAGGGELGAAGVGAMLAKVIGDPAVKSKLAIALDYAAKKGGAAVQSAAPSAAGRLSRSVSYGASRVNDYLKSLNDATAAPPIPAAAH